MKNKLRRLKLSLRLWSKTEYGDLEVRVEKLKVDIEELDLKGRGGGSYISRSGIKEVEVCGFMEATQK